MIQWGVSVTCEGVNGEQVPAVGLPDPHEVLRGYAHLQGRIQISGRGEEGLVGY